MGLRVVDPWVDPNVVAPGETAEPDVWYRAIGRVSVDGWPRATLDSGWLHELIVGTNVDYRTVSVSVPSRGTCSGKQECSGSCGQRRRRAAGRSPPGQGLLRRRSGEENAAAGCCRTSTTARRE